MNVAMLLKNFFLHNSCNNVQNFHPCCLAIKFDSYSDHGKAF